MNSRVEKPSGRFINSFSKSRNRQSGCKPKVNSVILNLSYKLKKRSSNGGKSSTGAEDGPRLGDRDWAALSGSSEAPELQTSAAAPQQTPGSLCAGLWLIVSAFSWRLERHRNAPARNDHRRRTAARRSGLVPSFGRWGLPFLDRRKLRPSAQDAVAAAAWPVRLLLRGVASLRQSWCGRTAGAE